MTPMSHCAKALLYPDSFFFFLQKRHRYFRMLSLSDCPSLNPPPWTEAVKPPWTTVQKNHASVKRCIKDIWGLWVLRDRTEHRASDRWAGEKRGVKVSWPRSGEVLGGRAFSVKGGDTSAFGGVDWGGRSYLSLSTWDLFLENPDLRGDIYKQHNTYHTHPPHIQTYAHTRAQRWGPHG